MWAKFYDPVSIVIKTTKDHHVQDIWLKKYTWEYHLSNQWLSKDQLKANFFIVSTVNDYSYYDYAYLYFILLSPTSLYMLTHIEKNLTIKAKK
jgi:hypothetical protein